MSTTKKLRIFIFGIHFTCHDFSTKDNSYSTIEMSTKISNSITEKEQAYTTTATATNHNDNCLSKNAKKTGEWTESRRKKLSCGENPERYLPERCALNISICNSYYATQSHT